MAAGGIKGVPRLHGLKGGPRFARRNSVAARLRRAPVHLASTYGQVPYTGTPLKGNGKVPSFEAEGDGIVDKAWNAIPIGAKRYIFIARGVANADALSSTERTVSRVFDVLRPLFHLVWRAAWLSTLFLVMIPNMVFLSTLVVQKVYRKCNPVYHYHTKPSSARKRDEEQGKQQSTSLTADKDNSKAR